jgi:thiazole/oxazole-forming peptide maturase SagD family component
MEEERKIEELLYKDEIESPRNIGDSFWKENALISAYPIEKMLNKIDSLRLNIPSLFKEQRSEIDISKLVAKFLRSHFSELYIASPRFHKNIPFELATIIKKLNEISYDFSITDLPNFTDLPKISYYVAECDEMQGAGFRRDPNEAAKIAVMEAIERRIFSFPKDEWFTRSKNPPRFQIMDIDISSYWLISGIDGGLPPKFNTLNEVIRNWVLGIDWFSQKPIWLPSQLVFLSRKSVGEDELSDKIIISPITSNGIAVGISLEDAIFKAILELVERDTFLTAWLNQKPPLRIFIKSIINSSYEELSEFILNFSRYNLELNILYIPTEFPLHCVISIIRDFSEVGPQVVLGGRSSFYIEEAIEKSIFEALAGYIFLRIKNQSGLIPPHIIKSPLPMTCSKPVSQQERRYYWGYGKNALNSIEWFIKGEEISIKEISRKGVDIHPKNALKELSNSFRERGYHIFYYTPPENTLKELNIWPMRVIIPELVPLYLNETEAPLHHPRLLQTKIEEISNLPIHPFP